MDNCTIVGNWANGESGNQGGGVWNLGTLYDCLIASNSGARSLRFRRCVIASPKRKLGPIALIGWR